MGKSRKRAGGKGMKMAIAIRGYAGGKVQFKELALLEDDHLEEVIRHLALKHCAALAAHKLHMIEIEFLDEPNQDERFFRFGTDPSGMVMPIELDLTKERP